jgi:hypothetical protein
MKAGNVRVFSRSRNTPTPSVVASTTTATIKATSDRRLAGVPITPLRLARDAAR